jgi:hypothetical protein
MANASGMVGGVSSGNPPAGEFLHAVSDTHYRIFQENGGSYF